LPHLDVASDKTGADGWVSIFTTGVEPILGVHIVTSPDECPTQTTPFYAFYCIHSGSPLLDLISAMTWPIETSRYFIKPNFEADTKR